MNFSAKLNVVFKSLKIKNSVIAQISGVDASLISRFRSGARIPKPNSPQLHKMCVTLIDYINDSDKISTLNNICGFPDDLEGASLVSALKVWLLNNESIKNASLNIKIEDNSPRFLKNFGIKLDAVMELLDLSNIQLSKSLDVDPSLVSRFRNGTRTPSTKNSSIKDICTYLFDIAGEKKLLHLFYELIEINPAYLNDDRNALIDYFVDWICDKKEMTQHTAISAFLYNLNYFTNNPIKAPSIDSIIDPYLLEDNATSYVGLDGLCTAVHKLGAKALLSGKTQNIFIYTDQDLRWLSKDSQYLDKSITYLIKLIELGGDFKIVHSMNHKPSEVYFEIEKLLPLHATGQLHSYYNKDGCSRLFSHTMFIIPGVAAVIGSCVIGAEEQAEYLFVEGDRINYYMKEFNLLLDASKPLLETISEPLDERTLDDLVDVNSNTRVMLEYTLPIAGLDKKLFEDISSTNQLSADEAKEFKALYDTAAKGLDISEPYTDFIPLADISLIPSKDKLKSTPINELLADSAYVMVPLNLPLIGEGEDLKSLYYSREQYVSHIRSLIKILRKKANYTFVPIEYKTYRTLRLMIVRDRCIIATNNDSTSSTFLFNHFIINRPFEDYIYSLQSQRYAKDITKEDAIKLLEEYVRFW